MSEAPATMTAVVARAPGGPAVLEAVARPVPTPGPGELLIRVRAAGVNRPDVAQRLGLYPPPPGAPDVFGLEAAGEVAALGEGASGRFAVGDRVTALLAGGGYAEYALAPEDQCLAVPDALSWTEAAAIPETLWTVWANVFGRGSAREGETLLVHGGTSGIGTTAIALGRLFDLTVIVTCGSAEKCDAARSLGAALAVNYREQDFESEVRAFTDGRGVDVVLDMVGGDYLARNLRCLAEEGRHVSIAVQRGPVAEVPIWDVMRRRLTLTGSTLRPRSVEYKAMLRKEIERLVWPYAVTGAFRPVIDRTFPLREAAAAHARMEGGDHVGKIVLEVG